DDARAALGRPLMGHRATGFRELYERVTPRLAQVFRTEGPAMLETGSATLVMESAILSTVEESVLNLTCGAFSERWHAISRACGKQADQIAVPWGEAITPDLVRGALRRKRYEAVTVVHSETSTGVLNPLEEIAAVIHEESDALVLVDTVSSLAGARVETDAWGLDIVLAGAQKALAVPPGLAVFTLSARAAERASKVRRRGFYTDLLRARDEHLGGGTLATPAMPQIFALDVQLERILEEGLEARWRRHLELRDRLAEWAGEHGFAVAAAAGFRSPTVTCLEPPDGWQPLDLVARLGERGWTVAPGYGEWKGTTFRIGHMGEVRVNDLDALLGALETVVAS
ncbi:MAG TPA: alanine--glyoxylate aminotransferase family protein, partial [Thermoanaerobaculia bacterium]|nr:alanine--glyoxylate aminotransferase family protein [Thermoanaerobaculia bacterium]